MSLESLSINELMEQLGEFRTRRRARLELLRRGPEAVEPLIKLLEHYEDGLAWCAVKTLGEIGDQRAVEPLIKQLTQGRLQVDVAQALHRLTGEDFGTDASRWQGYAAGDETAKTALPEDVLLQRMLEGTDWSLSQEEDSWIIVVPVKGNRSQDVRVLFNVDDSDGHGLIVVYTEAGPAHEKYYEAALRKNPQLPYGAIGIRDVRGNPMFVVVNTHLRASADAASLRKSIASVAQRGDSVEKALTGLDEN